MHRSNVVQKPSSHRGKPGGGEEKSGRSPKGLCIFYFRDFAMTSSVFIFLPLSFCLPTLPVQEEGDRKREAEKSVSLVGNSRTQKNSAPYFRRFAIDARGVAHAVKRGNGLPHFVSHHFV